MNLHEVILVKYIRNLEAKNLNMMEVWEGKKLPRESQLQEVLTVTKNIYFPSRKKQKRDIYY